MTRGGDCRRVSTLGKEGRNRVRQMKEQMEAMFKVVEQATRWKMNSGEALVKVAKHTDSDDIDGYLLTSAYEIDRSCWAFILAPQLTGRAHKAYMALADDDTGDYDAIKQAF